MKVKGVVAVVLVAIFLPCLALAGSKHSSKHYRGQGSRQYNYYDQRSYVNIAPRINQGYGHRGGRFNYQYKHGYYGGYQKGYSSGSYGNHYRGKGHGSYGSHGGNCGNYGYCGEGYVDWGSAIVGGVVGGVVGGAISNYNYPHYQQAPTYYPPTYYPPNYYPPTNYPPTYYPPNYNQGYYSNSYYNTSNYPYSVPSVFPYQLQTYPPEGQPMPPLQTFPPGPPYY